MHLTDSDPAWKSLYIAGSIAPLLTLAAYLIELVFIPWDTYPTTSEAWMNLFRSSKLLGLFYINALDAFSIALLGIMFLALHIALRRYNPSIILIATFIAFLGLAVFVGSRAASISATLSLSDQYTLATTATQRDQILAAFRAISAGDLATPRTFGFLFIAIAVLMISIVMLQSKTFSIITAGIGIWVSVFTFVDDISLIILPQPVPALMTISGVFWVIWWILISFQLLKLAKVLSK
jgi:hypothetical protein